MEHDCIMKPDVKEMTDGVKSLTIDVALIKADVSDLKNATVTMSNCIRTLTESSIIAQQTSVTRDKFYDKTDVSDKRIDSIERSIGMIEVAIRQYADIRKWVMGIVAAILLFAIFEGYRFLVK